jgi:hypothetical protein
VHQRNLFPLDRPFWKDLKVSISWMCRDLILKNSIISVSRLVEKLKDAGVHRVTEALIYAWCDPEKPQIPNMFQFFTTIKILENCDCLEQALIGCARRSIPEDLYEAMKGAIR